MRGRRLRDQLSRPWFPSEDTGTWVHGYMGTRVHWATTFFIVASDFVSASPPARNPDRAQAAGEGRRARVVGHAKSCHFFLFDQLCHYYSFLGGIYLLHELHPRLPVHLDTFSHFSSTEVFPTVVMPVAPTIGADSHAVPNSLEFNNDFPDL